MNKLTDARTDRGTRLFQELNPLFRRSAGKICCPKSFGLYVSAYFTNKTSLCSILQLFFL